MLTAGTCGPWSMCPPSTLRPEPRMQGGHHEALATHRPAVPGRWQGYLLHDGLREAILVNLDAVGSGWRGTFSEGDNALPLQEVKVDESGGVHFELQGKGSFDGSVAGDAMAGSVSGPSTGSFALSRHPGL